LAGGNLGQWLEHEEQEGTVDEATRIGLVARIARAVAAAHSVGIIHKDIKPSNVLIDLIDDEPRPCLTDFGIGNIHSAQKLEELGITHSGFTESLFARSTQRGDSGTRLYSAPEYLVGGQPTMKGDLYALGIILYQLMVDDLHRPLRSGWRRDVRNELIAEDIAGCVDVDPSRRFESAAVLAERLETVEDRRRKRLREMAATRRQQWYRVAAIVASLISVFLIYGFLQSRKGELAARAAESQALAAQQRSERLVNFLVQDLFERLEPIGRLDVLDSVVDSVRSHYKDLPDELKTESMQVAESEILAKLSTVRRDQGKLSEAVDLLELASGRREKLVEKHPGEPAYQFQLAATLDALGVVSFRAGDSEKAEAFYQRAIAIGEDLLLLKDADPEWENGLANAYNNFATMLKNRGDHSRAELLYDKAIGVRERLIAAAVRNGDEEAAKRWRYIQSWGQNNLGWFYVRRGDLEKARNAFEESQKQTDSLIPDDPENKGYRLSRSTSALGLADLELLSGNFEKATAALDISLNEKLALVQGDVENVNWRWRLSDAYRSKGRMQYYMGNLVRARDAYGDALETIRDHAAADPGNRRLQWQLGEALTGIARTSIELAVQEGKKAGPETVQQAEEAVDRLDALVEIDGDNETWRMSSAVSHMVLGRVREVSGRDPASSLPSYRTANALLEALSGDAMQEALFLLEHLEIICRLAVGLQISGDGDESQKVQREGEKLVGLLRQSIPEMEWLRRLGQSLSEGEDVSATLFQRPMMTLP
ncbi:MAG: tetratricopeptide repeat protein, partial [Verrucomicrobiota bacterium]